MALLSDYTSGTVSIDGTTVTGDGTAWVTASFKEGDIFICEGYWAVISEVVSETELELEAWAGGDQTDVAYRLRYMSDGSRASAQARQLIDMLGGSGNLEALGGLSGSNGDVPYFTGPGTMGLLTRQDLTQGVRYDAQVADIAARAAYNGAAEGFAVLVSNTGDGRAAVYSRVGGAGNWSAPAYITGPSITLDVTEVDEVPYGTPPDVVLTPRAGGYDLAFEIPRGMLIEPGTTTTLAPGQPAAVTFVPITGGYKLDIALPKGDTGNIDGVTPFYVTQLSTAADAEAARAGLGVPSRSEAFNRENHTGTQLAETISDFAAAVASETAQLSDDVSSVVQYVSSRKYSGCMTFRQTTTGKIFTSGNLVAVPFNEVAFDYDNWWDIGGPTQFWVPYDTDLPELVAVRITAAIFTEDGSNGSAPELRLHKNGSAVFPGSVFDVRSDGGRSFNISTVIPVSGGEVFQLMFYQNSGVARAITSASLAIEAIFRSE